MVWYTCTPIAFSGGGDFFSRDSGLVCKGLQSLGINCKSIMPLPVLHGDIGEDLIRIEYPKLEDSKWWRSIDATNVILYTWGGI